MLYKLAAGFMLLIGGVALLCVGAGYAGYALYAAFLTVVDPPWAALIAAGFLFFLPLLICFVIAAVAARRKRERRAAMAASAASSFENIALAALAGMAKDKPIMSVVAAGLVGAVTAFLRRRGSKKRRSKSDPVED